jgi:hypothetical protein
MQAQYRNSAHNKPSSVNANYSVAAALSDFAAKQPCYPGGRRRYNTAIWGAMPAWQKKQITEIAEL